MVVTEVNAVDIGVPQETAPGVYRLTTGRGLTGTSVYLVRSGTAWVLIDAA